MHAACLIIVLPCEIGLNFIAVENMQRAIAEVSTSFESGKSIIDMKLVWIFLCPDFWVWVNGSNAVFVIVVNLPKFLFVFSPGDFSAAKDGLARMKYYVNIEELLTDTLDLPS